MNGQNSFNWGKPTLFIKDLSVVSGKFKKLPTPIEDTAQLTPTRGEKVNGTVEGGEIEVSRTKKEHTSSPITSARLQAASLPSRQWTA